MNTVGIGFSPAVFGTQPTLPRRRAGAAAPTPNVPGTQSYAFQIRISHTGKTPVRANVTVNTFRRKTPPD